MHKELQTELLQLLCDFDAVCKKYNIPYTLQGGTLLGAVREHGFIPWDDDVDVAMTRDSFRKLLSILENTTSEFEIQGNLKKQFCRHGIRSTWVDIFIFDHISEKPVAQKAKLFLLTILDIMNRDQHTIHLSNLEEYSCIKQILFKLLYVFGCLFPKNWKVKCYTVVSEKLFCGNRKLIFKSNDQYKARKMVFPQEWISEFINVPFENHMLPIMNGYHMMLTGWYGENYMTPIKEARNTLLHEQIRSESTFQL